MASRVATMVLGLLMEGERHGYDLLKEMDERGMLRWTGTSKVAVYKALARLEDQGCLTSWTEKEGNLPEKRVYAITPQGEEKLRDLVYSLCGSREPIRSDTCVGLSFIHSLNREEAKDALEARIGYLRSQTKRLMKERAMLAGLTDGILPEILAHELAAYREEARLLARIVGKIDAGLQAWNTQ